jgi:hypothetical protein
MLTKVFWTLVALDGIAAVVLWKLFERGTHGLLILSYLIVVAAVLMTTCVFPLLRSDALRITAFVVPLLPSVPLLFSAITAAVKSVQEQRQFSGSAYFDGPPLEGMRQISKRPLRSLEK